MKVEIFNNIGNSMKKVGFAVSKHSPEILVAAGVAGTVASVVLACRATLKVNDVLDEAKTDIEKIHMVSEDPDISEELYTKKEASQDLVRVYAKAGAKLVKIYAPSVCLGVLSIGCMVTSNNILRKRNVALVAAYTAVDKGFKEYRRRVIDRFGEEVDREIKYNIKAEKVTETEIDEEGKAHKVKKTIDVVDDQNLYSEYAVIFDDGCTGWEKNAEHNKTFLLQVQKWANIKLTEVGHLFLNEVYDMLGFKHTTAGAVVGWRVNGEGDGYVDLGIFDTNRPAARDFVNGYERCIVIDPNVDGVIYDKI